MIFYVNCFVGVLPDGDPIKGRTGLPLVCVALGSMPDRQLAP